MKGFLLLCTLCAFVTGLSSEDGTGFKPSGSLFPPSEFDPSPTTPNQSTSTQDPKTTPLTTLPTPSNTTTPSPTTANTTTPSPTTSNTTTPSPTTSNTTTPSPTTSNTTTPSPTTSNTTTPSPTSPSNHTVAPTTVNTTTPSATTTVPPKPTQGTNLTVGTYTIGSGKDLCMRAQMALEIRVATGTTNGTFIVQPALTKPTGYCNVSNAKLTLTFKEGFITFMFNKSTADKTVYVDAVSFELSYPFKSGALETYNAKNMSVHLFAAAIGHCYSCKTDSLYMGNGLYLDISKSQMQAFNLVNNQDFGTPQPCAADKPDYRVPIAVGVVLLVLIVIVVIIYLLGRRKRASGYQSL